MINMEVLKKFKPQIVTFVISKGNDGKISGMVADWISQVSHDPPLFMVALKKKGYTQNLIRESKEFIIAVANKDLEKAIGIFGYVSGKNVDKFEKTGLKLIDSKKINVPSLKDATMNLECKLEKEVDAGDHYIFIGKVLNGNYDDNKKFLVNLGWKGKIRVFEEI